MARRGLEGDRGDDAAWTYSGEVEWKRTTLEDPNGEIKSEDTTDWSAHGKTQVRDEW